MAHNYRWRNWGRNQSCRPQVYESARSELEVIAAVNRARGRGQKIKVVGSGHSFSAVACTDHHMLSIAGLDRVIAADASGELTGEPTISVEAGITIAQLNQELASRGLALANLGDIAYQSISGAISTGTHGTGANFGGLSTFVRSMEMVTANGELVRCSPVEEPELFHCARVGLGSLGIITQLTLAVTSAFNLAHKERRGEFHEVVQNLNQTISENEHFEFYWLPHTEACSLLMNNRTEDPVLPRSAYRQWRNEVFYPNYFFGALVTAGKLVPPLVPDIARLVASTVGSGRRVDRSDQIFISTRLLRFVEMEYAIPQENVGEALLAIRDFIDDEGLRVSFPIEVRFVASDDIPLSMASGRASGFIAVHMARGTQFDRYFHGVEAIMNKFSGRPHWGKMHYQTATALAPRYPQWERFRALRHQMDPERYFSNDYLDRVLGEQ